MEMTPLTNDQPLKHGDLAYIRVKPETEREFRSFANEGVALAEFRTLDEDTEYFFAYWAYHGTDWTERPENVDVVLRVYLTTEPSHVEVPA